MTNSKYSNDRSEIEADLLDMWLKWERGDWYVEDGVEDKYNDRAFRDALQAYILAKLEQTRTNTIKAAVEALPEKHEHFDGCWQDESPWKAEHYSNTNTRNRTIDQIVSNLKVLIGGDDE